MPLDHEGFVTREDYMIRSWKGIAMGLLCLAVLAGALGCSGQPLSTREKGTLIGGALGGVGGFAVGNAMQNQEAQQAQTQSQIDQQQREIERQRREIQSLQSQQETE